MEKAQKNLLAVYAGGSLAVAICYNSTDGSVKLLVNECPRSS